MHIVNEQKLFGPTEMKLVDLLNGGIEFVCATLLLAMAINVIELDGKWQKLRPLMFVGAALGYVIGALKCVGTLH